MNILPHTQSAPPLSLTLNRERTSKGRILWLSNEWDESSILPDKLSSLGFDVRQITSSLVALGMIADFDAEVLWLNGSDGELTIDEILDALRVPRRINPLAVVLSEKLAASNPGLELGASEEIINTEECLKNPASLLQLFKVTRLERQIIQREHEILDSLPHALLVVDRELTLWKVNRQVSELLEISDPDYRKKALGRSFSAGLAAVGFPLDGDTPLPHLVRELERCVQSGVRRFRIKETLGGNERLLSGDITQLVHSSEHFLIDLRDITADEQAVLFEARRERLATIGNLSVGVAHEIQNPNTFSRVNAANLKMMFEAIKPIIIQGSAATGGKLGMMPTETFVQKMSEAIGSVDMASRRIEAVLTTLKAFGRQDDGQLDAVEIKPVVDEAVMLIRHEARGKSEIIADISPDLPKVIASATGLSQVLVNLLQNSLHAFLENKQQAHGSGNATITIRVETVNSDEVILSVSDNGPGIPENIQEKIFRPYFTTKPQGQGTGLGLSISTDILHRFGGDLTLRSRTGEGTTFYIKLRRHDLPPDQL